MEHIGPFHLAIAVFVFCAIATVAELDARLLRCFAASDRPLADAQFTARVTAQLHAGGARGIAETLRGALRAVYSGLAAGIAAPLRLRYAGLVALVLGAVTVWSMLQGL